MIPRLVDAPRVVHDARAIVFDKDGTLLDLDSRWVAFFTGLTDRALEAVGASDLRPGVLSALGVGPTSLVPHGVAAAGTGADVRSAIIASLCAAGHDRSAGRPIGRRCCGHRRVQLGANGSTRRAR
jgi:phosphoglycolate phosphatase-like HAD superfamily hydrolase